MKKKEYTRDLLNNQLASAERCRVLAAQDTVVRYLGEHRQAAWRPGFFKPCESAVRSGLGTYALMGRETESPSPLDPSEEKWASQARYGSEHRHIQTAPE